MSTIIRAADPWLDTVTSKKLREHVVKDGKLTGYGFGSLLPLTGANSHTGT